MAATILKMSDAETIKFLKLYRNEPILWDPSREDYKKRECRIAASRRIAAEMEIEGFTDIHVIMKFKNLRSSYLQELKKIARSIESGCPPDEVYTPKVYWFKIMDSFLKQHVTARKTQLSLEDSDLNNPWEINFENNMVFLPEENSIVFDNESQDVPTKSKEEEGLQRKRNLQSLTSPALYKKKLSFLNSGISETEKNNCFSKRVTTTSTDDCFDHFGRYVASLLRSLPQDRSFQLQADIISMILSSNSFTSCSYKSNYGTETIQNRPPSVENKHFPIEEYMCSKTEED